MRDLIRTQNERAQITGTVEAVLGHHDQPSGERALPWRRKAFETLVEGERLEIGGHIDRLPACTETVAAVIEAHDLLGALYADVKDAVALSERLDVVPAARGERPSVRTENWRHFGVGDADRFAVAIDDAATQPRAAIGGGNEAVAVRLDMDRGNSSESRVPGGKLKAATKLEVAEPRPCRIAIVE